MIGRLKKLFGLHVHTWSKYVVIQQELSRPCKTSDGNPFLAGEKRIRYTRQFQQRTCETCGLIERIELKLH